MFEHSKILIYKCMYEWWNYQEKSDRDYDKSQDSGHSWWNGGGVNGCLEGTNKSKFFWGAVDIYLLTLLVVSDL